MTARFAALTLGACALLAACDSQDAPPPSDNDGRAAEGEVLGGTISDDMLPLDTLRSQSPPQRVVASGGESPVASGQAAAAEPADGEEPSEPVEASEAETVEE